MIPSTHQSNGPGGQREKGHVMQASRLVSLLPFLLSLEQYFTKNIYTCCLFGCIYFKPLVPVAAQLATARSGHLAAGYKVSSPEVDPSRRTHFPVSSCHESSWSRFTHRPKSWPRLHHEDQDEHSLGAGCHPPDSKSLLLLRRPLLWQSEVKTVFNHPVALFKKPSSFFWIKERQRYKC